MDTEFTGTGVGNITGITYFADFEAYKKLLFVSRDSSSAIIELYQIWDSRIFPNILLAPDSEEEINGVDDNEELSQFLHDLHVQESASNARTAPIITPVPISSHSFSSSGAMVSDSQATEPFRNVIPITDATRVETDATHVNTDTMCINTDAVHIDTAAMRIDTAAMRIDTAATHIDTAAMCIDTAATHIDTAAARIDTASTLQCPTYSCRNPVIPAEFRWNAAGIQSFQWNSSGIHRNPQEFRWNSTGIRLESSRLRLKYCT